MSNDDDVFNTNPVIAAILGETKSQISPEDLPDALPPKFPRKRYPLPWRIGEGRGNNRFDVFASNGAYVAHIYVWDGPDMELFCAKITSINKNG